MSKIKKIIIVAGEESGDMYASEIINDLSKNRNLSVVTDFLFREVSNFLLMKKLVRIFKVSNSAFLLVFL